MSAMIRMNAAKWQVELLQTLNDCLEYFESREDAEYFTTSPAPKPNEEMQLATAIRELIAKAPLP